jgi:hypothetical protein
VTGPFEVPSRWAACPTSAHTLPPTPAVAPLSLQPLLPRSAPAPVGTECRISQRPPKPQQQTAHRHSRPCARQWACQRARVPRCVSRTSFSMQGRRDGTNSLDPASTSRSAHWTTRAAQVASPAGAPSWTSQPSHRTRERSPAAPKHTRTHRDTDRDMKLQHDGRVGLGGGGHRRWRVKRTHSTPVITHPCKTPPARCQLPAMRADAPPPPWAPRRRDQCTGCLRSWTRGGR